MSSESIRTYPMRSVRRQPGFTLLELLAGIAVFAVLSTIVLGGVRLGMDSWNAISAKSERSESIRVIHDFLRERLAGTLALAESAAGRWQLRFEGDAGSLAFVTEFPVYIAGAGVQFAVLSAEREGGSENLRLRWWPLYGRTVDTPQGDRVLIGDLSAVKLSYYGAFGRGSLPQWRNDWRGHRNLPQLVRIDITDADGNTWPPLIVRLNVDSPRFYRTPDAAPGGLEAASAAEES